MRDFDLKNMVNGGKISRKGRVCTSPSSMGAARCSFWRAGIVAPTRVTLRLGRLTEGTQPGGISDEKAVEHVNEGAHMTSIGSMGINIRHTSLQIGGAGLPGADLQVDAAGAAAAGGVDKALKALQIIDPKAAEAARTLLGTAAPAMGMQANRCGVTPPALQTGLQGKHCGGAQAASGMNPADLPAQAYESPAELSQAADQAFGPGAGQLLGQLQQMAQFATMGLLAAMGGAKPEGIQQLLAGHMQNQMGQAPQAQAPQAQASQAQAAPGGQAAPQAAQPAAPQAMPGGQAAGLPPAVMQALQQLLPMLQKLAQALQSGDPKQIQQAAQAAEKGLGNLMQKFAQATQPQLGGQLPQMLGQNFGAGTMPAGPGASPAASPYNGAGAFGNAVQRQLGQDPAALAAAMPGVQIPAGSSAGAGALAAARSQLGVREATGNNDGIPSQRYMNGRREPWCANFVSWAFRQAGTPLPGNQRAIASVQRMEDEMKAAGKFMPRGAGTPQPGDVIFFANRGNSDAGRGRHVGIVDRVENGRVYTVEGNSGNAVRARSYDLNNARISGYGRM